jgi:4-hydroxy-tetrahydrodipicolinate synthase
MKLLGRDCGEVRLPLTPLTDSQLAALRTTLQRYGLLNV